MSRYLGVDYGTKRIGLAVGERETGIASPIETLSAHRFHTENAQSILAVAAEYAASAIVIGLPLNMDGSEGPQAKLSRQLAEALRASCPAGMEVILHDERLTSFEADQRLAGRDLTRKGKKARQDAVAAAVLLQSFLNARRSGAGE